MSKQDAITWAGGVNSLARLLNMTTQAIYDWGDEVPRGRQFELAVKSEGVLKVDPKFLFKSN